MSPEEARHAIHPHNRARTGFDVRSNPSPAAGHDQSDDFGDAQADRRDLGIGRADRRGGWSIAGTAVSIGARVEATIGLGTNTPDEKARFMSEMMNLLRDVLGQEPRDETYITFHEFNHESYGRGGLTRAERERRRAAA